PTPKETLRTVKVRPMPEPWMRITTPWKTWTRERLPSVTLTCTLTVSPARNSGRSSRLAVLPRSATAPMLLTVMSLLTSATGQPWWGKVCVQLGDRPCGRRRRAPPVAEGGADLSGDAVGTILVWPDGPRSNLARPDLTWRNQRSSGATSAPWSASQRPRDRG